MGTGTIAKTTFPPFTLLTLEAGVMRLDISASLVRIQVEGDVPAKMSRTLMNEYETDKSADTMLQ